CASRDGSNFSGVVVSW
nr:immunoglobulin heavy chain junction region [Macaca mulatta]MOY26270.1 immunoglobulin heavy chain junction region [Macaca mulatta]MOY26458.1 immunoglobulin heavy chain junction region [Macaca mulatta]MOY27341.1 immunoglobulin heavy chain junction region [Macaca mulatta]MOY27665.1 immunoglobulin heavy chain junction region [Macaca mulatta]